MHFSRVFRYFFLLLFFFFFALGLSVQKAQATPCSPGMSIEDGYCVLGPNGSGNGYGCNAGYSYTGEPYTQNSYSNYCGSQQPSLGGCCLADPIPQYNQSCSRQGGYCALLGHSCNSGYTPSPYDFDCNDGFTESCCLITTCGDVGGYCALLGHDCAGGYHFTDKWYNCSQDNSNGCCVYSPAPAACTSGASSCTAWVPGQQANDCDNVSQTRSCLHTGGAGGCAPTPFTDSRTVFIDNCFANYTCTGGNTCTTNIFVHVYTDYNHSATNNGGGKSGVTISDNAGNTPSTDGSGNVTFTQKAVGNYTITEFVPANFQATSTTSQVAVLTNGQGNVTLNYYLTPLYSISGRVYNDKNKDQRYNGADAGYGGGTIHISGGPTAVADRTAAGDGTWATPTNLLSGTYLVTYSTSLAAGYSFTTPSSYSVTVGNPAGSPDCSAGAGSLDSSCGGTNSGSVLNLNIGLTNENAWRQSVCLDVRDDSGTYSNLIPAAPSCGGVSGAYNSITNADCTTGAGIMFSCDGSPDFGLGSSNSNNWQAGGVPAADQECFSGAGLDVIRTSYDYLTTTMRESGITPIDMATVCGGGGLSNCTLSGGIDKGVYLAEGDVNLNAFTFPFDALNPQSFIFLINGDLRINGNIIVPAGSVAAFSTSGSIYVDKSVGQVIADPDAVANNNPNIEGLYSADANFVIESYGVGLNICNVDGTPLDKKLNIVGSIITNAAKAGGAFLNNRDMCIYDLDCSSVSFGDGMNTDSGLALSYLLTLYADGKFLSHKVFNWQELRP